MMLSATDVVKSIWWKGNFKETSLTLTDFWLPDAGGSARRQRTAETYKLSSKKNLEKHKSNNLRYGSCAENTQRFRSEEQTAVVSHINPLEFLVSKPFVKAQKK